MYYGIDRAVFLSGFYKCRCGKLHSVGGTSATSKCVCGAYLWEQMIRKV